MSEQLFYEISEMVANRRKRKKPVVSCQECHRRKQKCDRLHPCNNCTKREKPHLCVYTNTEGEVAFDSQAGQILEAIPTPISTESNISVGSLSTPSTSTLTTVDSTQNVSTYLGYSENNKTGTLSLIKRAGNIPIEESTHNDVSPETSAAERYMSLVRQLPSQNYIQMLVQLFFSDLEWYYGAIDEDVFRQSLHNWNNVPYTILRRGPRSLPPDVRSFPALLFQVLAHALLFLPTRLASTFEGIKYASGMTFADLATEYSDAGGTILSLLRKQGDVAMATVQTSLLRAAFLKSTASVVQAWRTIRTSIQDGQELGLASVLDNLVDNPIDNIDLTMLDETERLSKLWLMLHLWDGHMGVVLGRPMITRLDSKDWVHLFADMKRRREQLEITNSTSDTPTPFGVFLLGYDIAYKYLQDIEDLTKQSTDGVSKQHVLDRVESIDTAIKEGLRNLPAWAHNDTKPVPDANAWLPAARETLLTEVNFVILAVHRPFVFLSQKSRDHARQAALHILASQNRLFCMSEPREYLPFNLIFATFDAMVLLATLYILFSGETRGPLAVDGLFSSMEWGLARLESMKMGGRNRLAGCTFDIVRALYGKMQTRRKKRPREEDREDASNSLVATGPSIAASSEEISTSGSHNTLLGDGFSTMPSSNESWQDDWTHLQELGDLPFELFPIDVSEGDNNNSISSLPPPQPLHDLIVQIGAGGNLSCPEDADAAFGL